MSKTLTLELPDEIYDAIEQIAVRTGEAPQAVALQWLARRAVPRNVLIDEAQGEAARKRFESHFGAWDSGDPNSADNERIDADLTRAYGNEL